MAVLSPEDVAYLRQQAQQRNFNPDDMLRVINRESSGRYDVWGGKGGNYFGLIQFGGPERQKYGVDTQNPNARNQIDAMFNFLTDRGYKPGMGLLDMYSTVNAGSPGHYNASDRPGATVASHVKQMMSSPLPSWAGSDGSQPMAMAQDVPLPPARSDAFPGYQQPPQGQPVMIASAQPQQAPSIPGLLGNIGAQMQKMGGQEQQQAQPQGEGWGDIFEREHMKRHMMAAGLL